MRQLGNRYINISSYYAVHILRRLHLDIPKCLQTSFCISEWTSCICSFEVGRHGNNHQKKQVNSRPIHFRYISPIFWKRAFAMHIFKKVFTKLFSRFSFSTGICTIRKRCKRILWHFKVSLHNFFRCKKFTQGSYKNISRWDFKNFWNMLLKQDWKCYIVTVSRLCKL